MDKTLAKVKELALRKFGPLPGWAWAALGLGTIGLTVYAMRSGALSGLTGGSAATAQNPQGGGAGAGGGQGGDTGGGGGATTPPAGQPPQPPPPTPDYNPPLIQGGGQQSGTAGGGVAPSSPTPQQPIPGLNYLGKPYGIASRRNYVAPPPPTPGGETSGAGPVGQDVNAAGVGPYYTPPPPAPDERQQAIQQRRESGLSNAIPSSTATLNDTSNQQRGRRGGPQVV